MPTAMSGPLESAFAVGQPFCDETGGCRARLVLPSLPHSSHTVAVVLPRGACQLRCTPDQRELSGGETSVADMVGDLLWGRVSRAPLSTRTGFDGPRIVQLVSGSTSCRNC
jgi:hypothetical protein